MNLTDRPNRRPRGGQEIPVGSCTVKLRGCDGAGLSASQSRQQGSQNCCSIYLHLSSRILGNVQRVHVRLRVDTSGCQHSSGLMLLSCLPSKRVPHDVVSAGQPTALAKVWVSTPHNFTTLQGAHPFRNGRLCLISNDAEAIAPDAYLATVPCLTRKAF
ncbi:hypothetical protein FA13DRAFT_1514240 [Coprinellus micaceus]|uniref:Uncharacterized protein n=1 Tax=Coprinellus micaceus TaxID=71717 RepID=A0A4Y7SKH6_COPMI|nr:hypothetical protein FA13DRAFT_1514240 [Coprinellus micaceus]